MADARHRSVPEGLGIGHRMPYHARPEVHKRSQYLHARLRLLSTIKTMSLQLAHILGITHGLVGLGSLFAPLKSANIFGIEPVPSTGFVLRLFGCRDLVLGAGVLATLQSSTPERRLVLLAANIINGIDIVSGLVSYVVAVGAGTLANAMAIGLYDLTHEVSYAKSILPKIVVNRRQPSHTANWCSAPAWLISTTSNVDIRDRSKSA